MNARLRTGFTLIELLITVTIMLLLLGGGVAAYRTLTARQQLRNSAQELQLLLRVAQKQARVGSKPSGCAKLLSYEVWIPSAGSTLARLRARCQGSVVLTETLDFANGVTSASDYSLRFLVLQGGVTSTSGTETTVTLVKDTRTATFTVNQGGEMSAITLGTL